MIVQREQSSKPGRVFSTTHSAKRTAATVPPGGPLEVVVMFTDFPSTLRALKTAAEPTHNLGGRIRLLAPHVNSQVSREFNQRRFQTLASQGSIDTYVEMCFCCNRDDAVCQALEPEALVVIGSHGSWWPTAETALARKLRRKSHHVSLVVSEQSE